MASKVYRDIHHGVTEFAERTFDFVRALGEVAFEVFKYAKSLEWWRPWMRELIGTFGLLILLMMLGFAMGWDSHFWRWIMPVLTVHSLLLYISYWFGPRTRQVMFGIVGIHWCLTALWVEALMYIWYPGFDWENPPTLNPKRYIPFCDFSPTFRCSTFMMSPFGRILRTAGLSSEGSWMDWANPSLGVVFYLCHIFYPVLQWMGFPFLPQVGIFATGAVAAVSLYYMYALAFVINEFCALCMMSYLINFLLLYVMHGIWKEETDVSEDPSWKYD